MACGGDVVETHHRNLPGNLDTPAHQLVHGTERRVIVRSDDGIELGQLDLANVEQFEHGARAAFAGEVAIQNQLGVQRQAVFCKATRIGGETRDCFAVRRRARDEGDSPTAVLQHQMFDHLPDAFGVVDAHARDPVHRPHARDRQAVAAKPGCHRLRPDQVANHARHGKHRIRCRRIDQIEQRGARPMLRLGLRERCTRHEQHASAPHLHRHPRATADRPFVFVVQVRSQQRHAYSPRAALRRRGHTHPTIVADPVFTSRGIWLSPSSNPFLTRKTPSGDVIRWAVWIRTVASARYRRASRRRLEFRRCPATSDPTRVAALETNRTLSAEAG